MFNKGYMLAETTFLNQLDIKMKVLNFPKHSLLAHFSL